MINFVPPVTPGGALTYCFPKRKTDFSLTKPRTMSTLLVRILPPLITTLLLCPSWAWSFAGIGGVNTNVGGGVIGGISFSMRPPPMYRQVQRRASLILLAEKSSTKKERSSSGEGFGKAGGAKLSSTSSPSPLQQSMDYPPSRSSSDGNKSLRTTSLDDDSCRSVGMSSPDERSRSILRSKFGLKSYEEQQADLGDYRALANAENKVKTRNKLRNIESLWPEDRDLLAVLPPSVIRGIDTILKFGLGLSTVLFILAGICITIEAGSKATGYPLPDGLEIWIVNVVEPNFTPGLGILLAFSVSLGIFSVSLGGSASSTYREK